MTEKVGGIEYDIDADSSGIVTAGKSVREVSSKMESDLKKVDLAVAKLTKSQKALGNTVNASGQVFNKSGKEIKGVTTKLKALIAQQKAAKASATGLAKAQTNVTKEMGGMGRKAGMAGVQIEQLVGSVQGGQDAMRAFSFQATDMGIVLGFPLVGAAIGLTTALVSALMPALFNSGKEVDSLKEKLVELQETQLLSIDQARFMAQEEAKTQKEKKKTITSLEKELASKKKSLAANKLEMEAAKNLANTAANTARKTEALRIPERIKSEEEAIIAKTAMLEMANSEYSKGATKIAAYKIAISGATKQTGEQKKSVESLIKQLELESQSIGKNSRELLQLTLQKDKAGKADAAAALAAFDSAFAKSKELKVNKDLTNTEKNKAIKMAAVLSAYQSQAAQLNLNSKQLDEYNARKRLGINADEQIPALIQKEIDALELLRLKKAEMTEQDKIRQVIEQEFKAVQTGQEGTDDPLTALEDKLLAEREIIKAHTDMMLADEELTQQQRNEIVKQGQDLRTSIDEDAAKSRQNIADMENKAKLNAVSQMFSNISSLMNTESKKMFEIGKAAAVAGAIVDGYAAIAGAYKVGAKLGGPALGGVFAATAAVQTAVQVQNIAKQKIGGAQTMGASSSFSGGAPTTNTQPQAQTSTSVTVAGINPGDMFTGQQMIDTLRSVVGDGADVSFLGAS